MRESFWFRGAANKNTRWPTRASSKRRWDRNRIPGGSVAKNPRTSAGFGLDPWVGKSPWRRKWQPSPVFWPGEFHGLRSLVGYSPRGHRVGHDWATVDAHRPQQTLLLQKRRDWSTAVLKADWSYISRPLLRGMKHALIKAWFYSSVSLLCHVCLGSGLRRQGSWPWWEVFLFNEMWPMFAAG